MNHLRGDEGPVVDGLAQRFAQRRLEACPRPEGQWPTVVTEARSKEHARWGPETAREGTPPPPGGAPAPNGQPGHSARAQRGTATGGTVRGPWARCPTLTAPGHSAAANPLLASWSSPPPSGGRGPSSPWWARWSSPNMRPASITRTVYGKRLKATKGGGE